MHGVCGLGGSLLPGSNSSQSLSWLVYPGLHLHHPCNQRAVKFSIWAMKSVRYAIRYKTLCKFSVSGFVRESLSRDWKLLPQFSSYSKAPNSRQHLSAIKLNKGGVRKFTALLPLSIIGSNLFSHILSFILWCLLKMVRSALSSLRNIYAFYRTLMKGRSPLLGAGREILHQEALEGLTQGIVMLGLPD